MALPLLRARDHRIGQAIALVYLGSAARRARDLPVAGQALGESLALYRDLGNCSGKPAALNEMGALHRLRGDLDQAACCHRRALELARQVDSRWDEAHARAGLGRCALDAGRGQDAAGRLRQALAIFKRMGAAQTAAAAEVTAELAALC
jgi:tetratricopeptide (TPR) repeat protein